MASAFIYLDESGDLGWKFDAPYRNGGSSRFLTISAACVPYEKDHVPKRLVKSLYEKYKWEPGKERKWVKLSENQRKEFASLSTKMCLTHGDIELRAIVVKKENVQAHIRTDGNKLYNYMIKLALLDYMAQFDVVTLVPDPRSIKVESGNSLHDYLQTELWFGKKSTTKLVTKPIDSKLCKGLQFSDMLAGVVQSRYEDNSGAAYQVVAKHIKTNLLFF